MNIMVKEAAASEKSKAVAADKVVPADEVNATLNKIFDSASDAIKKNQQRVTLEHVDKTIAALFEAINKVHIQGKKVAVPDFEKILSETKN